MESIDYVVNVLNHIEKRIMELGVKFIKFKIDKKK